MDRQAVGSEDIRPSSIPDHHRLMRRDTHLRQKSQESLFGWLSCPVVQWITLGELGDDRIPLDAAAVGEYADPKAHIGQPIQEINDARFQTGRSPPAQCFVKIKDDGAFLLFVQSGKIDLKDRKGRFIGPKEPHPLLPRSAPRRSPPLAADPSTPRTLPPCRVQRRS